jgi:alpha-L-arabinofuranosidase
LKFGLFFAAAMLAMAISANAQPEKISVDVAHPAHKVSPMLWGIFFEDINMSADGGLYPELVRNRSFEDSDTPRYWTLINAPGGNSTMVIDASQPLNKFNLHCLRVNVDGGFTLENDGYWGMNVVKGDGYTFKAAVRGDNFRGPLTVKIVGTNGTGLAGGEVSGFNRDWRYHSLNLTASGSDPKAHLEISGGNSGTGVSPVSSKTETHGQDARATSGSGTLFLDMVSLMPDKTWKNHGLRVDLSESLDALHPSFMRFPGGNWIEGNDLAHMYQWTTTIGDIDARTPLWNLWSYNTTQGLGFYEYLQLCEDLGAEPVFAINCGMTTGGSVPLNQMGKWIQEALDAIEYANGPTNSFWGGLRDKAGHPAPLNLKYMEIGNENGGPDYWQRWKLMADAIRAKYPHIKLIATLPVSADFSDAGRMDFPQSPKPDIVDEHYYESPESLMRHADQYDKLSRNGPQFFIGEYASTEGAGLGNLRAAIGEAAFMTGLERNSDIVTMASYAPLFVNMNHRAFSPDLINFDSSRWYGTPSYYVQQMFSNNRGDVTLPVTVNTTDVQEQPPSGCIGVGTWNTEAEFKDIKVTAPDGKTLFASDFSENADGWKLLGGGARWSVQDGALRQTAEKPFIRALAGDKSWTDYTLELKARKIAGRNGFLILFHVYDDDEDRIWWSIGGQNNTRNILQSDGPWDLSVGAFASWDIEPGHIETNRWYDIKIQLKGKSVQCWLDGHLIHTILKPLLTTHCLYASATRDDQSGDVILKLVNAAPFSIDTEINLAGVPEIFGPAQATVLTSASPRDENSLEDPTKLSPKAETFDVSGPDFHRTFPGNSFTVLRIKIKN